MIDHLLWAVPNLAEGIQDLTQRSSVQAAIGGSHPGVGTHNALLHLDGGCYLEIIAPDPAQDRLTGLGLLLKDLQEPRLATWAANTRDIEKVAENAQAAGMTPGEIMSMSRHKPDGTVLRWRLVQIEGHPWGPLMPFFLQWLTPAHPSQDAPKGCRLKSFSLTHPDADGLQAALSSLGLNVQVGAAPEPMLQAVIDSPRGAFSLGRPE